MFPDPSQAPVELQTISVTAELLNSLVQLRNNNQVNHDSQDNLLFHLGTKSDEIFINLNILQFAGESARLGEVVEAASQWLSQQLTEIDRDPHPHDLAVVAHSLHTAGSPSSEAAFQLLSKYRVESGEMMFLGGRGWRGSSEDGGGGGRGEAGADLCDLLSVPVSASHSPGPADLHRQEGETEPGHSEVASLQARRSQHLD